MNVKERVQKMCKERGISARELEQRCGFAGGFVSKLDKSSPSVANVAKLAEELNVSVDYLMGRTENPAIQMPIEEARLIAHNVKNAIDYYTDPATAEMMQKLFESPGRRALFNAVADMDEESVQKYADFIERITHDNNQSN